ncbi:ribosome small subunit-dependent GTPase A [Shouchella lonarensis]|uniref:Small ribosomal subunit biogenesis GTPase RsgA n=1 Tax=Shouchella lonarensis TaxID=1464122 RepID=A0A1G6GNU0_9BACI|nr:ribosome small subunit-dependent GTPase A [Shouchella lonarensis]SDB83594.1 ribosome biogenesis GTPase [Shouchella lonarensis]
MQQHLQQFGWKNEALPHGVAETRIARVTKEFKNQYVIEGVHGTQLARVPGKFHYTSTSRLDYPAVGDWVVLSERQENEQDIQLVEAVLPRSSAFVRQAAGEETAGQIVAANVTKVFIVIPLFAEVNVRKLERFLFTAWDSGASPEIILSKADLSEDAAGQKAAVASVAMGVPIHIWSAVTYEGFTDLQARIASDDTIVFVGTSGAGKSTLMNALVGQELLKTSAVRSDDHRGRHTTTHRELVVLPTGGIVIDTPGVRELQLWYEEDRQPMSETSFSDIKQWMQACFFNDCQHETESGCAIKEALATGDLSQERWDNFLKLQREYAYAKRKQDKRLQLEEKKRWKRLSKYSKRSGKR